MKTDIMTDIMIILVVAATLMSINWILIDQEKPTTTQSLHLVEVLKVVNIDTWLPWDITEDDTIYINIVNANEYPEQAELIKSTILSNKTITFDKRLLNPESEGTITYYLGWAGALEKASKFSTDLYIPKNIKIITTSNGAGDIIIRIEERSHYDGKSAGITERTPDQGKNKIIKAVITVYDINDISDNSLQGIMRHELGHAFGLAHSNDPDDLMYTTLGRLPFISTCDANAITMLYNGLKEGTVLCVK